MAGGLCVASRNSRIFPERHIYQRSDEADDSVVIKIALHIFISFIWAE